MNIPSIYQKLNLLLIFRFYITVSVKYQFSIFTLLGEDFRQKFWNSEISLLNAMVIRVQCHANVSKQTMLSNVVDVGPPKWHICGNGLNGSVYECMNDISNVKVHLKNYSGNLNIRLYL